MTTDRAFWIRLYVAGLIICLLVAIVLNLLLGYGFVDPTGPGPFHGPSSPLNGMARGEYGLWDAIQLVLIVKFIPYAATWSVMFAVSLICFGFVRWIGSSKARN